MHSDNVVLLRILTFAMMTLALATVGGATTGWQILKLDGVWKLTRLPMEAQGQLGLMELEKAGIKTIEAQVPGDVHLDLMRAGEMPNPSVSANSRKTRWPERFSWWYRTTFEPPTAALTQDRQELVFDGLIYYAQVFLNGKLIGSSKNGLVPARFDVTGSLKQGQNELVVRVTSGYEFIGEVDQDLSNQKLYANRENFPAREKLRTPPYQSGWDWNDTMPNIGIWRSVRLEAHDAAKLEYVHLDTVRNKNHVALEGIATIDNLKAWRRTRCSLRLELARPNGAAVTLTKDLLLMIGSNHVPCRIDVPDPQLWWPNGMGAQPLYKLTATLISDGITLDSATQSIGLRTIQLDESPRKVGANFRFIVNGKEVFCKGGNWAPADEFPVRMTPARYEHFIQAAKEAHFTMLRVNGVGYYEDDAFYEACDRAGILLWQEFAYSCAKYDDRSVEFMAEARREAEAFVKRIANHPSIALWCGCNECLWMYAGDRNPTPNEVIGTRIYCDLLPKVVHELDPTRPYIPGSPCGGTDDINSQTAGDVHWWYEVFMSGDPARKMDPGLLDTCTGRFVSEYGIIGPPPLASMKEYLTPSELTPDSLAWRIHTNSYEGDHRGFTESAARHHFLGDVPMSVEQFVLYGGLYQAMMQEQMMEAGRFRKHDPEDPCDGSLMWSYNDCWGEIGWSIIDHYGRPKPSYYAVKRACAPVKVVVRKRTDELVTRVVNDTLEAHAVQVTFGWYRADGKAQETKTLQVRVPANGTVEVARSAVGLPRHDPKNWVFAASMTGPGLDDDHSIWKLTTYRELVLPAPHLKVEIAGDQMTVTSETFCAGVHMPEESSAKLSDNYFELLPGVPHTVRIVHPSPDGQYELSVAVPAAPNGH